MSFDLPELDQKKTKEAVESALEKYRIFRYLAFEEREVSITASSEERFHGPTNATTDQTSQAAIYNADQQEYRRKYCERLERSVNRLAPKEKLLIEKRYLESDAEYKTDIQVYTFDFQPPISQVTYGKIRWKAFYKLALILNITVTK
ncbi:ArpU family phage packaging/lysis transcriptional regulator [Alkalihalophilus lindianensis]|uniref:ArpU family phage packaging/lysis transcriptional regulator n=1 Tax=Alkalihalophilus lindianensis TaxID=1630542 RepID=A0ABU3X7F4_9BACI|nr:ArpU family phage packaging/lysis transcriptional regulator [Alkalihalophilus lindianensis]MDV2683755.1 ArpU family phage packaging/lysis transcriptional regulator [Alkalihalophilus lindianensis]MDV2683821.1 ArpU family phage packaging/lysis transcriptional regulator [Alkalihalophilus lindianensis]